jgi:hypothetical protein
MNYEFLDLGLILINFLFCGLLLHKQNKLVENNKKLKNLLFLSVQNPKLARKQLNNLNN